MLDKTLYNKSGKNLPHVPQVPRWGGGNCLTAPPEGRVLPAPPQPAHAPSPEFFLDTVRGNGAQYARFCHLQPLFGGGAHV